MVFAQYINRLLIIHKHIKQQIRYKEKSCLLSASTYNYSEIQKLLSIVLSSIYIYSQIIHV